jgi:hypothetical protein
MLSSCIFGSTARNSFDSYSDRDMLVVAPSKRELVHGSRHWLSTGWSVANFTHQQISRMAARGSLFLQHLKQEAIIIRDDDGFLFSLMDRYQPKQEYEDELSDSIGLLHDLSRQRLDYWPTLCSADIAYVAIRNIAIARLASKGKYAFDYGDLIGYFGKEHCISTAKLTALRQLRLLKHSYRNRLTPPSPWRILGPALEAADELFGLNPSKHPKDQSGSSGYRGLRLLELELVGRVDPRVLDGLPLNDPLAVAWALIRDPRGYPDKPTIGDHRWMRRISDLAERRFATS